MPDTRVPAYPMKRDCPFDPPPELGRIRAEDPVTRVRLWDGSQPWLITGYDDQRAVLRDRRFSADVRRPGYPHVTAGSRARRRRSRTFISMDEPEHGRYRRMLTSTFMIKRVEALRPRIQGIVDELIDTMLAGTPPVDLVSAFALPVPSLVICELLGVPYADHDFFQRCSRAMVSSRSTPEEAVTAGDELKEYLIRLLGRKADEPADDLLSRLVVEQAETMTRSELADMGMLLLVAGHETTANMIALGTLTLLQHPDQLAELRDGDPVLIKSAVEELLRYLNIVHSGRRRVATEDVEVGGRLIRAGEGVIVATDAGNRDEKAFPDPDVLDLHREARHHVAFGYGVHQCLGQPLARVELQVVYGTLYRRVPTLRLAVPLEEIRFKHDMLVYGVHELPVSW
ncbi:cytochrome P450 [Actinoallomurus iriomotensis]|uniref:Cytochrome P450 n=1 Tax=Actinoallomurus iriomotensis TaxID=478107 RepID=A0A9W6W069_9ACTN|nr:cytochrome P450 [Actinoallomurus iriomotensis]GLY86615.1 cytochrome P450 [Actinoallomurus iriomotensis]